MSQGDRIDKQDSEGQDLNIQLANKNLQRLLDLELAVSLSFGQTTMLLKDVLRLGPGSIIELDHTIGEPVSVVVNNKVIARGEVVVVDGNYGVRITEIQSAAERIRSLA